MSDGKTGRGETPMDPAMAKALAEARGALKVDPNTPKVGFSSDMSPELKARLGIPTGNDDPTKAKAPAGSDDPTTAKASDVTRDYGPQPDGVEIRRADIPTKAEIEDWKKAPNIPKVAQGNAPESKSR